MDQLASELGRRIDEEGTFVPADMNPNLTYEEILVQSSLRQAIPARLLELDELECLYQAEQRTLWTFMRPRGRPSFSPSMLSDFEQWQNLIAASFGPGRVPLDFLVLGSRAPGVFCFGGDLQLFAELIRSQNRESLVHYGRRCVEILDRNISALDLPLITVGLVQGNALGGGFEALLSFDFIIAERGSLFGLPETMFGLFPGMGAHPLLSRKLGTAMADRLILSDARHTAEEMYDLGIVHQLAEPGEGVQAVKQFIAKSKRRHTGLVGANRARRISSKIELSEFYNIVDVWADTALQLTESDLKVMLRLASVQEHQAKAA